MYANRTNFNREWIVKTWNTARNWCTLCSSTITGGFESFYRIEFQELHLFIPLREVIYWKVRCLHCDTLICSLNYCQLDVKQILQQAGEQYRCSVTQKLLAWCNKHREVSVIVGGPAAREVCHETIPHRVFNYKINFVMQNTGLCVDAAISNAAAAVRGTLCATDIMKTINKFGNTYTNLKQCFKTIQKLGLKLQCRKPYGRFKLLLKTDPFYYTGTLQHGVWLLRLVQLRVVDHVICIDANRRIIIDSTEKYPLSLSPTALKLCGGSSVPKLAIAEVYRLDDLTNV